jgi:toluene monooxygenase system ferredoxin subunit
MTFALAAKVDELWEGEMRGVSVGGLKILLVNVGGQICAYEDRCAHQRAPLSEGRFDGRTLTCARHEWTYDACTGCGINPATARLKRYSVRVEGGDLLVDIPPSVEKTP